MAIWQTLEGAHEESQLLKGLIEEADAVVVGIGAGMSAADGFTYTGERFTSNFPDFIEKYKWLDMLQASLEKFPNWEEYWAFQSRFIELNYLDQGVGEGYLALKELLQDKAYRVITTNADNAFYKADYDMDKVIYYQGEYVRMQCSEFCHDQTYRDDDLIRRMVREQENLKIPSELVPRCPKCQAPLEKNKRTAEKGMVEDAAFNERRDDYNAFLKSHSTDKTLFLEIGVGHTTPQFIKHPFWRETRSNDNALYVVMNQKQYRIPENIKSQAVFLTDDIQNTILNANK